MASPFLLKRRAGWYVRVRIPADIADAFGATHLTRSLSTRDHPTARRRAVLATAAFHGVWLEARAMAVDRAKVEALQEFAALPEIEQLRRLARMNLSDEDRRILKARIDSIVQATEAELAHANGTLELVEDLGAALENAERKGIIRGMEKALERMPVVAAIAPAPLQPAPPPVNPRHQKMWHAEVVPAFFEAKGFGDSTKVSHERAFRECCDLLGDKPIVDLTPDDIRRYRDWLVAKPGKTPGSSYAHQSIVKDLGHIKSFLTWAVEEDYLTASPGERVKAPEAKSPAAKRDAGIKDEDRRAFTVPELKRIFDSPLYTGCQSRWFHRDSASSKSPIVVGKYRGLSSPRKRPPTDSCCICVSAPHSVPVQWHQQLRHRFYPRVCGGHSVHCQYSMVVDGSSPRVRICADLRWDGISVSPGMAGLEASSSRRLARRGHLAHLCPADLRPKFPPVMG